MAWILDDAGFVTGTFDGSGAPAGSTSVPPPANAAQPLRFVDGAWLATVERTDKFISLLAFYSRFTTAERVAIRQMTARDPIVADFMMLVDAAKYIDLDMSDTQMGVAYLVSIHVLTEPRAGAILGVPILQAERP